MNASVLEEFQDYANFSVRVDRFFRVINVYGRHHHALKYVYSKIPPDEVRQTFIASGRIEEDLGLLPAGY